MDHRRRRRRAGVRRGSARTRSSTCTSSTTVTSKVVGTQIPPVTVDSLVAPTTEWAEDHGTLGVKVVDRTGTKGVANITVTRDLDRVHAARTGDRRPGLRGLQVGPGRQLHDHAQHAGLPRPQGNQMSRTDQTVVAKKVSFATMHYDRADAARNVSVTTHIPGTTWSRRRREASKARDVSATNGAESACCARSRRRAATTPFQATQLFPFARTRTRFFTGRCGYAEPDAYKRPTRTTSRPTNPAPALLADPAQVQPQPWPCASRRSTSASCAAAYQSTHVHRRRRRGLRAAAAAGGVDRGTAPSRCTRLTTKAWPGGHVRRTAGTGTTTTTGSRRTAPPSIPACRSATTRSAWRTARAAR